jgi:hypothetical protein
MTKMGSRLVRWAALEAVARYQGGTWLQRDFRRIAARRGKTKPASRWPASSSRSYYYALRGGEIRCMADQDAA